MKLRCLLRGHTWGPLEGLWQATVHTCTHCGKTKPLGLDSHPDDSPPLQGQHWI